MTTWQKLLRDADPAAEDRLTATDVERLRQTIVAAAREPRPARIRWHQPLAMAALLLLMIASGIMVGRRGASEPARVPGEAQPGVEAAGERRQLQFSTPGGTRIIWVFDPAFEMKETLP